LPGKDSEITYGIFTDDGVRIFDRLFTKDVAYRVLKKDMGQLEYWLVAKD
jgi:hypothetical protein